MFVQIKPYLCLVFLIGKFVDKATACNGYSLKVNEMKNCAPNSVVQIENGNAELDQDCNLIMSGCLNIVKGFKTAKGKYLFTKNGIPLLKGDTDFCETVKTLNSPEIGNVAKMYDMPTACPLSAKKVCGSPDKKINIGKYKSQLGLAAGNSVLKVDVEHDTGRTCIELDVSLTKAKRARG